MSSCSKFHIQNRERGNYYLDPKNVQYFLEAIPSWNNYSEQMHCRRNSIVHYLDIDRLKQDYFLSYESALQLQYMFNSLMRERYGNILGDFIPFQERDQIFYRSYERVNAGFKLFEIPRFKRLHLISVDFIFQDKKNLTRLKSLMNKKIMQRGVPIFVSLCKNEKEMKEFFVRHQFNIEGNLFLSSELFSSFRSEGGLYPGMIINFKKFFGKSYKLHFFLEKGGGALTFITNFPRHYY